MEGNMMDIAIIGAGAAGISVLREIVSQLGQDYTLTIYSNERLCGTGLPYQDDDETLLLNQYSETMSLNPDDKNDFVDWVKKTYGVKHPEGKFFPRSWYGRYLNELFAKLLQTSQARLIKQEVTDLEVIRDNRYRVKAGEHEAVYDRVHLAIGHLSYQDPYELEGTEGYIHVPYPVREKVKGIEEYRRIGILGTGLTAIDMLLYVKKIHPDAEVSMFSRSGTFGSVRGIEETLQLKYFNEARVAEEKEKHDGWIALDTLKQWFIEECVNHGIDLSAYWHRYGSGTIDGIKTDLDHLQEIGKLQSVIHSMTLLFAQLWNALTNQDRQRFIEDYADQFTQFRSPMPPETARKIVEYVESGTVSIYSGIASVTKEKDSFKLATEAGDAVFTVDLLLNGTGQQKNLAKDPEQQQALVRNLLDKRIIQPNDFGGIDILYPSMSALSPKYGQLNTLKIYGQIVSGVDYMNNTVSVISASAIAGVKDSIQHL